jgi:VWFA-related protein
MKNFVCLIGLIFVFSTIGFAQGRPTVTPSTKKTNERPAATPTPTPQATPDESTATIQPINEASPIVSDDDVLRVETTLVSLPVQVMDRNGRFIGGLLKEDFQVFEDGKLQNIEYFGNLEQPFTVALILDMSYSTVFKTEEIQAAAIAFTAQLRPNDKVMVIAFDQEINLLCNPTIDRQISRQAIKSTKIGTGTSVYETIDFALDKLKLVSGRKAIVLFSDGVDTTSRKTAANENLRKAEESDVLIFPIQYDTYASVQEAMRQPVPIPIGNQGGTPSQPSSTQLPPSMKPKPISLPFPSRGQPNNRDPRDPNDPRNQRDPNGIGYPTDQPIGIPTGTSVEEYRRADEYLNQLALRTGGRLNTASSKENMALSFSRIADELRQFYTIGYYPANDTDIGKTRRVKVKVNREKTVVRTKVSYILGDKKPKKK